MKALVIFFVSIFSVLEIAAQDKPEGLFINSKAPDFKGIDQSGNAFRLKDALKQGPVVLVLYRGYWCPYCNRQLKKLQDSMSLINEKGAQLIAVTSERSEGISKTIGKTNATFPILFDEGLQIVTSYKVKFEVDEKTVSRYKNAGIDLAKINGEKGKIHLPVPAVYIISKEGTIVYRFFEMDYKKRVSVLEILDNLK